MRRPATRVVVGAPVALTLVVAALLAGRAELAIMAVGPLLVTLGALGARSVAPPRVHVAVTPSRAVEGDDATWTVVADGVPAGVEASLDLQVPTRLSVPPRVPTTVLLGRAPVRIDVPVHCADWGRHRLRVAAVTVRGAGFVRTSAADASTAMTVLPEPHRLRTMIGARQTQATTGVHASRRRGAGLEFADLRRYVEGDRPRMINWRATARSADVWVNDRHPERSADVVLVIDATLGGSTRGALDDAVRAAAGIADVVLRRRDRVGYVGLGGRVRWLLPGGGLRQWYRLAHTLVGERPAPAHPGLGLRLLPPAILPPDALVIALGPLLDDRMVTALADLQRRGNDVAAVEIDPLAGVPVPEGPRWRLARRLFALERERVRGSLGRIGVDVVPWSSDAAFATAVARLVDARQRRRPAQRMARPAHGPQP